MTQPATIVIVDDSPIARETLVDLLTDDAYQFSHAENGLALFKLLDSVDADVILLDVMMPGLDGYEVCRQLKSNPDWQHIPVILVTALDTREALIKGLDAGADEFLSKPIYGAVLRARVRSMLRIKQQYDALQKVLDLRENLAAMIVHDMRSPLSTIILYLELMLRRGTLPADEVTRTERLLSEARRLDTFINDMLLLTKMEEDKLLLHRRPSDLTELVATCVENCQELATARKVTLQVSLPAEPVKIDLDANLFSRTLDNLLNNAIRSSPALGTVTVNLATLTKQKPYQAQLEITDQGRSIPEEHWDDVFDKFSIASLKQKGVTRVGLPLAFAQMILQAHDGLIKVRNNEPQGTIFTVLV
ncbi:MAG: hybrid sensor histidine kinase/response regulator [Anaerolineales bacterium]|nr:hybrid sensor histidine kinase/response regulator [Anaerolineales bacterium]